MLLAMPIADVVFGKIVCFFWCWHLHCFCCCCFSAGIFIVAGTTIALFSSMPFFADHIIVGTAVAFFGIAVALFLALQLPLLFSLTLSFFL